MALRIYTAHGNSMAPYIDGGDALLVRHLPQDKKSLRRADLVIANPPASPDKYMVKRVVGLPGELVELGEGLLSIDGRHLVEPYLNGLPAYLGTGIHTWRLAEEDYFLMGDNRLHSTDSRDFGPVSACAIIGRASLCLWPPKRWRTF